MTLPRPNRHQRPPLLPSLLAQDIQTSLKNFLVTGFKPAAPFLHGLMSWFVEDEPGWVKGQRACAQRLRQHAGQFPVELEFRAFARA